MGLGGEDRGLGGLHYYHLDIGMFVWLFLFVVVFFVLRSGLVFEGEKRSICFTLDFLDNFFFTKYISLAGFFSFLVLYIIIYKVPNSKRKQRKYIKDEKVR